MTESQRNRKPGRTNNSKILSVIKAFLSKKLSEPDCSYRKYHQTFNDLRRSYINTPKRRGNIWNPFCEASTVLIEPLIRTLDERKFKGQITYEKICTNSPQDAVGPPTLSSGGPRKPRRWGAVPGSGEHGGCADSLRTQLVYWNAWANLCSLSGGGEPRRQSREEVLQRALQADCWSRDYWKANSGRRGGGGVRREAEALLTIITWPLSLWSWVYSSLTWAGSGPTPALFSERCHVLDVGSILPPLIRLGNPQNATELISSSH